MARPAILITGASSGVSGVETPLLNSDIVDGVVDYNGRSVKRAESGGWKSAYFIIGVEAAERFAVFGISANLINYLTGPLGLSTVTAVENVNVWAGTVWLLPLLGAFIADSYLGHYRTIIISSIIYVLGLGILTLSAVLQSYSSSDCDRANDVMPCSSHLQLIIFFFSLYLVAIAQGGHKPCVLAFGADQFDADNPEECRTKSSFFNWWFFSYSASVTLARLIVTYTQENLSWGVGFGIPSIVMSIALVTFLLGTRTYRFRNKVNENSAFVRIGKVLFEAAKNWRATPSALVEEEEECSTVPHHNYQQFKFLNKALLSLDDSNEHEKVCNRSDIEEAKAILRLVPVWTTCLVYGIVFVQPLTLFTEQGVTMDRSIGPSFKIPSASLQSIVGISVIILLPVYDRILVPIARRITGIPSGITMLQRIGTGIAFSVLSMVIAALVEKKRLETALEYGLVDRPGETIPMSIWWLAPQYLLFGVSDIFIIVGLQEFFYDQMPSELKSLGVALFLSVLGIGSFLSSFLIAVIEKTTGGYGKESWFSSNLNRAHLDYFYWLLAGLLAMAFVAYLYFMKSYIYNQGTSKAADKENSPISNEF